MKLPASSQIRDIKLKKASYPQRSNVIIHHAFVSFRKQEPGRETNQFAI